MADRLLNVLGFGARFWSAWLLGSDLRGAIDETEDLAGALHVPEQ